MFFESVPSTTKAPISFLQNMRLTSSMSTGQHPVQIFHLETTLDTINTFWFTRSNTFPKLFARGSLVQGLSRFSQNLHYPRSIQIFKNWRKIKKIGLLITQIILKSYCIKAETLDILRQLLWSRNCMIHFNLF